MNPQDNSNPVTDEPQTSIDYSAPKPKNKKTIFIIIAAVAFLLIVTLAVVLASTDSQSGNTTNKEGVAAADPAAQFLSEVRNGNVDKLTTSSSMFQDEEDARTTVDWLQAYIALDSCAKDGNADEIKKSDTTYSQYIYKCNLKDGKNFIYVVVSLKNDKPVYFETSRNKTQYARLDEMAEAFEW